METTISTKGSVQLPGMIRRRLGLKPGDSLDADIEDGNIVLKPSKRKKYKSRIVKDPITGMSVLTIEYGEPILTNEMVGETLADFP
jgi:looped-hinge helix DNA binding domain, AbrB family